MILQGIKKSSRERYHHQLDVKEPRYPSLMKLLYYIVTKPSNERQRLLAVSRCTYIRILFMYICISNASNYLPCCDYHAVSESKLKFAVQDHGFASWSDFKSKSKNDSHFSIPTSLRVNHAAASTSNSQLRLEPRNQAVAVAPPENDRWHVTVKATYRKKTMLFDLFPESKKEDLEKEVMKRVNLQVGSFYVDYKNEAGLWIYIGCDADLKRCMDSFRSSDRSTLVEMVVQLND